MKQRTGFVSNSSSSSFILYFPPGEKPKTVGETLDRLYHDGGVQDPYGENNLSPGDAAGELFSQIEEKEPLTREELIELLNSGWADDDFDAYAQHRGDLNATYKMPQGPERSTEIRRVFDSIDAANLKHAEEFFDKEFAQLLKDGWEMYEVEYGDHDSVGTVMEHGNAFRNVKHMRISHH